MSIVAAIERAHEGHVARHLEALGAGDDPAPRGAGPEVVDAQVEGGDGGRLFERQKH
jgi:hypothetical protein